MRKKRHSPIKVKPTYAVVVDGKTEVWYLNMLVRNERNLNVKIKPELPNKKSLLSQFELVKFLSVDYSKVFWVLDFDVVLKESRDNKKGQEAALDEFHKYKKIIDDKFKKKVSIIINNPCLEFWLLLHFECKTKPFDNCKSAENKLKTYLPDYKKSQKYYTKQGKDIYLILKPLLEKAIMNSKQLPSYNPENPYQGLSEMHHFFDDNKINEIIKTSE